MSADQTSFNLEDHTFNLVTTPTKNALDTLAPEAAQEYQEFKADYFDWLATRGKNPDQHQGYADTTLKQINSKTDQIFRWLWDTEDKYTLQFGPDEADAMMAEYASTDKSDATLLTYVKAVKRYFKYLRFEQSRHYEWECDVELSQTQQTDRDYLQPEEFHPLYTAALDHGSVRHYHQVTPEERDRIKTYLAQRLEKPKSDISPEEFAETNSYKIPSLISVTLDVGLQPIEVSRAVVAWINGRDDTLDIPADAAKSDSDWKCDLSDRSMRTLGQWLDERKRYEKYDGTDSLWLNRRGNPYNSNNLNNLLDNLIESSSIEPRERNLTWNSIRHGVATAYANNEGEQYARRQLRHERLETTIQYVHSSPEARHKAVNNKW